MFPRLSAPRLIVLAFAGLILLGTLLLKIPAAYNGISWTDAFFESVSAVTVTGLQAAVPKEWIGKSLANLHLSRQGGLTVLAIKPKGGPGTIPSGDTVFREGDVLVVGGTKGNLDRSKLLHPRAR